jgi:hypothetical protein
MLLGNCFGDASAALLRHSDMVENCGEQQVCNILPVEQLDFGLQLLKLALLLLCVVLLL